MSDKEQKAIKRIQMASEMSLHHYGKPLVCTYSGGKDSDVMLELFKRSGIPFDVHNSHTTADAPQTVHHIRKVFSDLELQGIKCEIEMPVYKGERTSMWNLIPQKLMPPTRLVRYCCSILKETGCRNRYIATGVRWDESTSRKHRGEFEKIGKNKRESEKFSEIMLMNDNDSRRRMTELCMQKNKMVVNPIIDWTHHDIWEYIHSENIATNELYQCGYDRVGCIGCPMSSKARWKEFADFPAYKSLYLHAFEKMLTERERRMKKKAPEQELKELCKKIREEIDHWEDINRNGCNDPFWPDGCNMNLTRNHIIYAKSQITQICDEYCIPIPEEMYLPTPPEVSDYYMASLKKKRRVKSIGHPERLTTKRNKYDRGQMSLF